MRVGAEILLGATMVVLAIALFYAQYRVDKSPLPIYATRPFLWTVGFALLTFLAVFLPGDARPIEYLGYPALAIVLPLLPIRMQGFPTLARLNFRFDQHADWSDVLVIFCVFVWFGIRH